MVNKIALCYKDDKRYIQEGQTDTLALGHYKIFSFGNIILKIVFSVLQIGHSSKHSILLHSAHKHR